MGNIDKELRDLFKRQSAGRKGIGGRKGESCLTELAVHRYLERKSSPAERERVEKHLIDCYDCLQIMAEASKAKEAFDRGEMKAKAGSRWTGPLSKSLPKQKERPRKPKTKRWFLAATLAFFLSFLYPAHFIQFSVLTLVFGMKWVVESRSQRILIALRDAWQSGDRRTAEEFFEKLEKRK